MTIRNIAIVGAGIIGCSWAMVWARAGYCVTLYDADSSTRDQAASVLQGYVNDLRLAGVEVQENIASRVLVCHSLEETVAHADYVQESVPESVDIKRALFKQLDELAPRHAILASSTSAIGMSRFTSDLAGRARCVIVHPATPPHLLPVVEIVPGPHTDPLITQAAFAVMSEVGQTPVLINKEIAGFAMNRMQGALLIEMFRLIEDGVISADHADKLISDGFGLRWAFLGPLEGVDLNAPGGIADYLARFGHMFDDMAMEPRVPGPVLNAALIDTLDQQMRARVPLKSLEARRSWRNQRIASFKKFRATLDDAS